MWMRRLIIIGIIVLLLLPAGVVSGKGGNNGNIANNVSNTDSEHSADPTYTNLTYKERFEGNGTNPVIYYDGSRYIECWVYEGNIYLNGQKIMEGDYKYVAVASNGLEVMVIASGWRVEGENVTSYVDAWVNNRTYNLMRVENNTNERMIFAGRGSIAVDTDGNFHVAFSIWYYRVIRGPSLLWRWVIEGWAIYYVFYDGSWSVEVVDGKEWSNPSPIENISYSEPLIPDARPVAIINEHVHIFYVDWKENRSHIYEAIKWRNGWDIEEIYNLTGKVRSISASSYKNLIYLVWDDDSLGPYQIFGAKFNGSAWEEPMNIRPEMAQLSEPRVLYSYAPYQLNLIWMENWNGSKYLHYGILDDGELKEIFNTTANSGDVTIAYGLPTFLVERNGKIYEIQMRNTKNVAESAKNYIGSLPDSAFKNHPKIRRWILKHEYDIVTKLIEKGRLIAARMILRHGIIKRMDGYFGGNPRDDWIIEYKAQRDLQYYNSELLSETGEISITNIGVIITGSDSAEISFDVYWRSIDSIAKEELTVHFDGVDYHLTPGGMHHTIKFNNLEDGKVYHYWISAYEVGYLNGDYVAFFGKAPTKGNYQFTFRGVTINEVGKNIGADYVDIWWYVSTKIDTGIYYGTDPNNLNHYVPGRLIYCEGNTSEGNESVPTPPTPPNPPHGPPAGILAYPYVYTSQKCLYIAVLNNLQQNTMYYYRIVAAGVSTEVRSFKTHNYELHVSLSSTTDSITVKWYTNYRVTDTDNVHPHIKVYHGWDGGGTDWYSSIQGYWGEITVDDLKPGREYGVEVETQHNLYRGTIYTKATFDVIITNYVWGWVKNGVRYHVAYYYVQIIPHPNDYSKWDFYVYCKKSSDSYYSGEVDYSAKAGFPSSIKYTFRKVASEYNPYPSQLGDPVPSDVKFSSYKVDESLRYDIKVEGTYLLTGDSYSRRFTNLDPLNTDSDNDGLSDAEESTYYNKWYPGLNPNNWDTDGDQFSDGREIREGTNPINKYSHPGYLFMFYIDTDNSLADIPLEEKIEDFKNINNLGKYAWVTVLYDTYGKDAYEYYYGYGSYKKDMGELDMGNPETLINFVKWSVYNYGGTRTVLVIYDHGNAWRGLLKDESQGSEMSISQLKYAMNVIKNYMGGKINITVFDACYMGNVEVAYELRGTTDIIVASAETKVAVNKSTGYVVWPYKRIIENISNNYDEYSLATDIVDEFSMEFNTIGDNYGTMVALNENILSKNMFENFTHFAEYLYNHFDEVKDIVKEGIENKNQIDPQHPMTEVPFYGRDSSGNRVIRYFDMADFIMYIRDHSSDAILTQLCNDALDFFNPYWPTTINTRMIINYIPYRNQDNWPYNVMDISIYILDYGEFKNKDLYKSLDFCKDSLWDEFLEKLSAYMEG